MQRHLHPRLLSKKIEYALNDNLPPEGRLIYAIIDQAIRHAHSGDDKIHSRKFLRSGICQYYMGLIGLDSDYFYWMMEKHTNWYIK